MIQGTYKVISDPIRGGMGCVYRVHHTGWDVDLAMKRPHAKFFAEGSEKRKENFIHECRAWIDLGLHPNIVSCYYVREIGGVPTIFSEWMENGSLENRIDDRTLYEGTPEQVQKRLLDIAIQFARGLHYAHESGSGLIHQDVKPDNLLMSKKWDAKVADFGLARARTAAIVPNGGYTPAYCSPEQSLGEPLTRRTDIYSWAVSILEMYLGEAGGSTDPDCFFLDENFRLVPLAPEVFRNRDQTLFYDAAQVRRFEESRERGDVAEMVRIHRDCLEIPGFGGSREAFQMEDVLEGKAVKNSLRAVRSISEDKVRGKFSGGETVLCSEGRIPGQGKSASGNEGQLLSGGGTFSGSGLLVASYISDRPEEGIGLYHPDGTLVRRIELPKTTAWTAVRGNAALAFGKMLDVAKYSLSGKPADPSHPAPAALNAPDLNNALKYGPPILLAVDGEGRQILYAIDKPFDPFRNL